MLDTLDDISRWLAEGKRVAQATVVSLIGSAPRGAGATLVVSDAGDIAGSVSNGCVEPDVVEQAQRVMRSGKPHLLTYGVSEEQNLERIGLSCGGEIRVFVERITRTPELDTLEASASHGTDLVRQILLFARGEEGRRIEIQMGHLLHGLKEFLKTAIHRKIDLDIDCDADVWPLAADATRTGARIDSRTPLWRHASSSASLISSSDRYFSNTSSSASAAASSSWSRRRATSSAMPSGIGASTSLPPWNVYALRCTRST